MVPQGDSTKAVARMERSEIRVCYCFPYFASLHTGFFLRSIKKLGIFKIDLMSGG
ncbi:hypothetical protein CBU_1212a [Coxiella burnetii RSA 493]|uniref:Uncharacterized protein n=1 Tax=Coxiella burnetii (strain RSA 493 / Nine Mile phase I) TaxID=227377 RepID=B5QSB6_COXBU|nr:hypothetical protein CBU_1212a [Coxiella burnetii RSA 493]BBL38909.1 hypothetical protein CBUVS42_C11570 [Coxiella burnetii]